MSDKEIKLECLKLADKYAYSNIDSLISTAEKIHNFCLGTIEPEQRGQDRKN